MLAALKEDANEGADGEGESRGEGNTGGGGMFSLAAELAELEKEEGEESGGWQGRAVASNRVSPTAAELALMDTKSEVRGAVQSGGKPLACVAGQ